jgi:hypothetical protein
MSKWKISLSDHNYDGEEEQPAANMTIACGE